LISRTGFSSRRKAEQLIFQGKVKVGDTIISNPATKISENSEIKINDVLIPKKAPLVIYVYYKPKGLIVTKSDEKSRPTIFENLPKQMRNLISVGRLDKNTSGLLLLTNDGHLARFLELPKNKFERKYEVKIRGKLSRFQVKRIMDGLIINRFKYQPIKIRILSTSSKISNLELSLIEGKNREIRRIMEYFETPVIELKRISYGPYGLNEMKPSEFHKANLNYIDY
tara:strand:- start:1147 stop:1824 length:678 start_codon:yes stop_codon:yes gene_type:complete